MADRLALSLLHRRQLCQGDFEIRDGGAVLLSEADRKTVLTAWQERKKEERKHPFLDENALLGLVPHLQAQIAGAAPARRSRRLSALVPEVARARQCWF